jgi:hypothetical protein
MSEVSPGVLRISSCRVVGSITIYRNAGSGEVVVDGLTEDGELTHLIAEVPSGVDGPFLA